MNESYIDKSILDAQSTESCGLSADSKDFPYITVKDLQDRWAISRASVYRMLQRGDVISINCGRSRRILLSSVLSYEGRSMECSRGLSKGPTGKLNLLGGRDFPEKVSGSQQRDGYQLAQRMKRKQNSLCEGGRKVLRRP